MSISGAARPAYEIHASRRSSARGDRGAIALPAARLGDTNDGAALNIRVATLDDVPFIDGLQRAHSRMVGWFPMPQLKRDIERGDVLLAEEVNGRGGSSTPLGYCIARDRYFKRDDCGIVFQLNVSADTQRRYVGASLIRAVFQRAAYGCKLFCCWCAQDLEANYFWESLGFVPLAFRTGSRTRGSKSGKSGGGEARIHIFWQRRVREGDCETPYWYPSETSGGAIRENRLVLPIPPGTHWSDAKPALLPGMERVNVFPEPEKGAGKSKGARGGRQTAKQKKERSGEALPSTAPKGGLWFAPPPPPPPTPEEVKAAKEKAKAEKAKAKPKRLRNDPTLIAAARELRDRYIEQINAGLLLPPAACGKWDVSRAIEDGGRWKRASESGRDEDDDRPGLPLLAA